MEHPRWRLVQVRVEKKLGHWQRARKILYLIAILFSEFRNDKSISSFPVRLGQIEPLNLINPKWQSTGQ